MSKRCEHGLTTKECYVCASPMHGEPPHYPHKQLADRLRRIASGEWELRGDENYLRQAAEILDTVTSEGQK